MGSVVKQRNFARRRIFSSTDVCTRMREAKSRHDMDTAGVKVEIISLCIFTELQLIDTVFLRLLKQRIAIVFDHMVGLS